MKLSEYLGPKIPNYITGTLPAGDMRGLTAVGARFYIIESDGVLSIKTNTGTKNEFTARQGEFADPDALYERIEIYNDSGAAPVTFKIFYGFGEFIDGTSEVIGSVTISSSALPTGASTSALQTSGNTKLDTVATWLNTISGELADVSTETTLAAILAKIIAAPSTEAKQDAIIAALASVAVTGPLTDAQLRASSVPVTRTKIGAQGNAWNAAAVGAGGTSNAIDSGSLPVVSAFGTVDAATTVTVQVSEDNATFYDTSSNVVLAGAGDFHVSLDTGARYVRLKSSGAATITATVSAKA